MSTQRADWISLVETGYALDGTEAQWLQGIVDRAAPLLGRGSLPMAWTFQCTPQRISIDSFSERTPCYLTTAARLANTFGPQSSLDFTYRTGIVIGTASELVYRRFPETRKLIWRLLKGRVRDLLVITCHSGDGGGVAIGLLLRDFSTPTEQEKRRWPQIAAHIGAAFRLRHAAARLSLESPNVEGVLEPGGRVLDVRGDAEPKAARERLREMVRRMDHARTRAGREDVDSSLEMWEGLVDGRWSLVDRFESDGRRTVVALKNDPAQPDPRGLTARERQVAEYVGLGRTSKEIAYTLGLCEAAITNCTARIQKKLGLGSRSELVAFFALNGFRRKLAHAMIAGERVLFGSHRFLTADKLENLTKSEREIVAMMVAGSTNSDIAQRRGSSERTVANQVQSVFQKLRVHSRGELVASLQC